ncbi:MAG: hypothetical protein ACRDPY_40110 [Streptosporangiaceae bacterium]
MEQAEKERVQREIHDEASRQFPGAVQGVTVLQHGDERGIKRAGLMVRVLISPEGPDGRERPLRAFEQAHRTEIEQFRSDLSQRLPQARRLQLVCDGPDGRKVILVPLERSPAERGQADSPASGDLTPVMARLAPAELDIVDTLISGGIAANRAEAIRWALARVSERPAYTQLRERTREIERLRTEF